MKNISTLDISENSYSTILGKAITTLWIELQNSIDQETHTQNDSKLRYFAGKIIGLRFALSLLRDHGDTIHIASSKIVFRSSLKKNIITQHAQILRTVLNRDFEVLNEGGKDGVMKEWLEGHIHAIGLALAVIQPYISNSTTTQINSRLLSLDVNHVDNIMCRMQSCIPICNSQAKTKARVLSSWI